MLVGWVVDMYVEVYAMIIERTVLDVSSVKLAVRSQDSATITRSETVALIQSARGPWSGTDVIPHVGGAGLPADCKTLRVVAQVEWRVMF